jgi:PhnB protein
MKNEVSWIPEGYHSATPHLIIRGAAQAIEFYKQAFGAKEMLRMDAPDGTVGHAEIKIGDSVIMLGDENIEAGILSPKALNGSPVSILLYVQDVDAITAQAVAAGAKITRPIKDQFYGDRTGGVEDPFGHQWYLATHIEDVPLDEMKRRMAAMGN